MKKILVILISAALVCMYCCWRSRLDRPNHGTIGEQVKQDAEELHTMRVLGRNMTYLLRCQEVVREAGIALPEREEPVFTNFIK